MVQVINHWFRFAAMLIALFTSVQLGAELRGKAETRVDYYPEAPLFPDQSQARLQPSFAIELELRESLGKDITAAFSLFGKIHPDAERELSGDVREAWLGYYGEYSEWRAGMLMERWGVLEAENIVDVLNPRDAVEDFQGDVKLGIPGLQATYLGEEAQFDAWLLPYARPRHLAEGKDRFRTLSLPLREAAFEGGRFHPSFAARASTVQGNLEAAVSHFYGHSRTPWFKLESDTFGRAKGLQPIYDLINQTNLELLWVQGHSLWKLEALHNFGLEDDFFGLGVGVEREVPRLWNTRVSLTLYAEGYYDDRDDSSKLPITPFQQDLFIGARLALNDVNSTEFQVRVTHDLEYDSTLLDLRASRRLSSLWTMEAVIYGFLNVEDDPALGTFQNDHRIHFKLTRGF